MHGEGKYELTSFDKLAVGISWFGALVLGALHMTLAKQTNGMWRNAGIKFNNLQAMTFSPAYAVTGIVVMLFLAYYGVKMRRLYNNSTASIVLFCAIASAVMFNGAMIKTYYQPAGGSLQQLHQDDNPFY